MKTEEEIASFITEHVNASQRITGAKLGQRVNVEFPDFKLRFGKLRLFVQRFCGDTVKIVGNVGADDLYASFTAAELPLGTTKPPEQQESTWRAFATPGASGTLCVSTESGEIRVRRSGDPEPLAPWVDVPKVSPDDHRQIASDFLPQIDPEDLNNFQHIPQVPDFWPAWSAQMRTFAGGKYSKKWSLFRFNRLCELYLNRLNSLNVSEQLATASLGRLKELKTANYRAGHMLFQRSQDSSNSVLSLRSVARAAIEAMSEDELRRVWLPLGLVADAVRKSHSD